MDKWREHSSKALTSSSDPHGAEANWQYWLQSILGKSSSETSSGSFTAKKEEWEFTKIYVTHTFNMHPEHQVCSLQQHKFMSTKINKLCQPWFGWQCFLTSWKCLFKNVLGHSNKHVQRQRERTNLEQGQDRCDVLAFRQYCLSNANKVLDIFHTSQGHLFSRLLITVISSHFPFFSHHIEWHFYTTCLYCISTDQALILL